MYDASGQDICTHIHIHVPVYPRRLYVQVSVCTYRCFVCGALRRKKRRRKGFFVQDIYLHLCICTVASSSFFLSAGFRGLLRTLQKCLSWFRTTLCLSLNEKKKKKREKEKTREMSEEKAVATEREAFRIFPKKEREVEAFAMVVERRTGPFLSASVQWKSPRGHHEEKEDQYRQSPRKVDLSLFAGGLARKERRSLRK